MSLSQVSECLSCQGEAGLGRLLPHLAGVVVQSAGVEGGRVCIRARARAGWAACPRCGVSSGRVHDRYQRRLADVPLGGRPVVIRLAARRFCCDNPSCPAATFAEQVDGLTSRRARRTPVLAGALTATGLALAGRAGARLAAVLGMPAGRWSLLRLVMALPGPGPGPAPEVLGVDDFAFRRGQSYGTLLVDMHASRPVDLLQGRDTEVLRDWLDAHPGAQVICRDRAGGYAAAARGSAPGAVQIADRGHLWHNLCGHAAKTAARHRDCLAGPGPEPPAAPSLAALEAAAAAASAARAAASPLVTRTRQRYQQVQDLRAQGADLAATMAATGLGQAAARRYRHASCAGDLLATAPGTRPSVLDPYKPYLTQRWADGARSFRALHAEITARGYPGSYRRVQDYLQPFRALTPAAPKPPPPPKTSQVARWLLTSPTRLESQDHASLAAARARCPDLDHLASHIAGFAKILTRRTPADLASWITAVNADDSQPDLHTFTLGLEQDLPAVTAALTRPENSGKVEGHVNRLKMLKRQMYGRATPALLRQRVLHTP